MSIFATLRKILITLWFWTGTVLATLITGLVVLMSVPFRELNQRQTHDRITFHIEYIMACFIYYWMTLPRIWSYTVLYESDEAREAVINNKGAFILTSNHSSIIDTLFMAMLPFQKTYTYNGKWSNVPIFGKMCKEAGYVDTHPKTKEKQSVVDTVIKRVNSGYSVMIYPEGTRTKDPTKLTEKIKTGAFRIAQGSQRPVLPLAFLGMYRGMSRYGIVDIAKMACVICMPINVQQNNEESEEKIDDREEIDKAVQRFRATLDKHLVKNSLGKTKTIHITKITTQYETDDEVW